MGGERERRSWILSSTCDSAKRPCVPSSLAEMMTITRSSDPEMEKSLVAEWEKMKYWLAEKQASAAVKKKEGKGTKLSSKRGTLTRRWKQRRSGSSFTERTVSTCAWGQATGRHARGRLWFTHPKATLKSHLDVCFIYCCTLVTSTSLL